VPLDPHVPLIGSFPVPSSQFAQAKRCRVFGGGTAFGHDEGTQQIFDGFLCHVDLEGLGVIAGLGLAPADVTDLEVAPARAEGTTGYFAECCKTAADQSGLFNNLAHFQEHEGNQAHPRDSSEWRCYASAERLR
jgi:hypothetical protein